MDEYWIATTLGLLIVMQLMIIWECIRMKGRVEDESSSLRDAMGDLGALMDEAIDYIADIGERAGQASPVIQAMGGDLKNTILTSIMSKMMMPPSDSDGTKSAQERSVHQIEETNLTEDEI